jgi:hypothetical protein
VRSLVSRCLDVREGKEFNYLLGCNKWLSSSFNSQLAFIVPSESVDLSSVSSYYRVIITARCLGYEFVFECFNHDWLVPRPDVTVAKLPIVVESTGEHFSLQSNEDRVV